MSELVPHTFDVPVPPSHPSFRFEVLGPEHNEADLAAWTSSIDHIHSSPGWHREGWPTGPVSPEENRADLTRHRDHHERRLDFAWTVLDPDDGSVVGCVYLKPDPTGECEAEARSWVRADCASLDVVLRRHLMPWWRRAWPVTVRYAAAD